MKKYKIIIVENDEDERFFMEEAFREADLFHIIGMFNNGAALFEWLEAKPAEFPDLILSDLNMPGKNGVDILRYMLKSPSLSAIPVIITSTSSTKSIVDKCLAEGARHYVVKPETLLAYKPYVSELYDLVKASQVTNDQKK